MGMTTQILLLRAVNVGGRGKISMADLRTLLTQLGAHDVRTVLQSGNAVLRSSIANASKLEAMVESALAKQFQLRSDVIMRSAAAWDKLIAGNPFPDEAKRDPSHLLAVVCKTQPPAKCVKDLSAAAAKLGPEVVRESDGLVYIHYPAGVGRSKLTTAVIERTLGVRVTARNWNTVLKLQDVATAVAHNSSMH